MSNGIGMVLLVQVQNNSNINIRFQWHLVIAYVQHDCNCNTFAYCYVSVSVMLHSHQMRCKFCITSLKPVSGFTTLSRAPLWAELRPPCVLDLRQVSAGVVLLTGDCCVPVKIRNKDCVSASSSWKELGDSFGYEVELSLSLTSTLSFCWCP